MLAKCSSWLVEHSVKKIRASFSGSDSLKWTGFAQRMKPIAVLLHPVAFSVECGMATPGIKTMYGPCFSTQAMISSA